MMMTWPPKELMSSDTLPDLLAWWSRRYPEMIAHVDGEGRELSYAEWRAGVDKLVDYLVPSTTSAGREHWIGLSFRRSEQFEFVIALLACQWIGAVPLSIPDRISHYEAERLVDQFGIKNVLFGSSLTAVTAGVEHFGGGGIEMLGVSDILNSQNRKLRHRDVIANGDDLATAVATSGSTGSRKHVGITHSDFLFGLKSGWESGEGCLLHCFPPYVIDGQNAAIAPLTRGVRVVTLSEFMPETFVKALKEWNVTETILVPLMAGALVGERHVPWHLPLRVIRIGSAGTSDELAGELSRRFPFARVFLDYSLTESGWAGAEKECGDSCSGSVGRAYNGSSIRIARDGSGEVLSTKQQYDDEKTGVVELKLPAGVPGRVYCVAAGERDNVEVDGWISTGDVGFLNDEGCLFITSREKADILTGGLSIPCEELEGVVRLAPGVKDALAVGVPSATVGEEIAIAVEGISEDGIAALRRFLSRELPEIKRPHWIIAVPRIPVGPTGKPDRASLISLVMESLESRTKDGRRGWSLASITQWLVNTANEVMLPEIAIEESMGLVAQGASSLGIVTIYSKCVSEFDVDPGLALFFSANSLVEVAVGLMRMLQSLED